MNGDYKCNNNCYEERMLRQRLTKEQRWLREVEEEGNTKPKDKLEEAVRRILITGMTNAAESQILGNSPEEQPINKLIAVKKEELDKLERQLFQVRLNMSKKEETNAN